MKTLKSKYIFGISIICMMFLATTSFSQGVCDIQEFRLGEIKGRVMSIGPNGDEPIPKAKIELQNQNNNEGKVYVVKTVYADNEGFFDLNLDKVKRGKYLLAVGRDPGFITFHFVINLAKKKKKNNESLYIKPGVSVLKPCGGGKVKLIETLVKSEPCNKVSNKNRRIRQIEKLSRSTILTNSFYFF